MTSQTPTHPQRASAELSALRAAVRGQVHLPGDAGFDQVAAPWNLAVRQSPAAVVEVADAADVVAAVRWAGEHGLSVSAQPGGHGATPAVDGTILLRTAALDEVWVDADAGVARVGAGVKWGALLPALDGTGRIGLAGSNPDVSVVGYLLGGGMSWFGRRYGVAARALRAVEIVDGTGRHRWVTDETDPDLMWALRGGGGEFGIVTRVEIALQREPELHGGKLMFPIEAAGRVLAAFAQVTADAPDGLTCWASLMHFPDVPFLPDLLRGRSFAVIDATWLGTAQEGAELLAPFRAAADPIHDTVGPVTIGRLGEVAAEPTDPTPAIDWSTTLSGLEDATIDRLLGACGDRSSCALTSIQLRHLGGAFAVPSDNPGATDTVPGAYMVFAFGIPAVPELVDPIRGSLAALAQALSPESLDRVTLTMLGEGMPLSLVHDEAALDRLRAVKGRLDPAGVIRGNRPLG